MISEELWGELESIDYTREERKGKGKREKAGIEECLMRQLNNTIEELGDR